MDNETVKFRKWMLENYGIQDASNYENTQAEEFAIKYAQQQVKNNVDLADIGLSLPDSKLINLIDYCKKFTDGSKTSEQLEMWKKWEDANFLDDGKLLIGK